MKCDELETEQWLNYGGEPMPCYPAKNVDEAVAELKAENERMKKKMDDYHLMSDIRRAKIKELKRALWLARAERAEARKNYWYVRSIHEGDKDLWSIDGSAVKYIGCIKSTNYDWLLTWSEVESKCLKKAEEYR